MSEDIAIRTELRPGDLGKVIELHGRCYEMEPGFGLPFEAYVAQTVAEYVLDAAEQGCMWLAERGDELVGCSAIVLRRGKRAQLRWVLVDHSARGVGLGKQMVQAALDYSREQGCKKIFLETTDGLPESSALYEKLGFVITASDVDDLWDGPRLLIVMELDLE